MDREDFKIRADEAAVDRDAAIERLSQTADAEERVKIAEELKGQLNRL